MRCCTQNTQILTLTPTLACKATLDASLAEVKKELDALGADRKEHLGPYAFVSHDDIKGVDDGDDTLIAIKAPSGTTLEVPDPDQGMERGIRRFQIYLTSSGGGMQIAVINESDKVDHGTASPFELGSPCGGDHGEFVQEFDEETDDYFGVQHGGASLCELYP